MSLAETLLALEHEGWDALTSGRPGAFYRELTAPNAVMAFPFGVMSRAAAIDAMEAAPPWETYAISDPAVVELTQDCAVLVYTVVAQRSGQSPYTAVMSSTYARNGERWRLAFHQQSPAG